MTSIRLAVELLIFCHQNHVVLFICSRSSLSSTLRLAPLESSFFLLLSFAPQQLIDAQFCSRLTTVAGCEEPYFLGLPVRAAPNLQPRLDELRRPNRHLKIQNCHSAADLAASKSLTRSVNFKIVLLRSRASPHLNLKKFSFKPTSHQLTTKLDSPRFDHL